MKEYVISYKLLKSYCKHVQNSSHDIKTRYACGKKMESERLPMKDYKKYIECTEKNCPILNKCDELISWYPVKNISASSFLSVEPNEVYSVPLYITIYIRQ